MKKSALLAVVILFFAVNAHSQIRYGLRGGLSSTDLKRETIQANGVSLAIKDASYGFHFGVFARGKFTPNWYIQPEVVFSTSKVSFTVNDFQEGLMDKVLSERYNNLDIPLMVGYKFGPLRLEGGPVGHIYIASNSELEDQVSGYEQRFNNFNLGYQAGVGLDIWKILFDLRYEGNFTKFGDHIRIGGEDVKFSNAPTRWVLSAGFSF